MGPNDARPLGDSDGPFPETAPVDDEQRFADEWDALPIAGRALWGERTVYDFVRWLCGFSAQDVGLTTAQRGTALLVASRYLNAVDRDAYIRAQIANVDDGADAAFERAGDR